MLVGRSADVCVIGAGIIGRCTALALAARGVRVDLVSRDVPGASSRAAAGLLAPSLEGCGGSGRAFAVAARDAYPAFLAHLESSTGRRVEHGRAGILEVALDADGERPLREAAAAAQSRWLSPNEVHALEGALAPTCGGTLLEHDGYVDNVALMDVLTDATRANPLIRDVDALVTRLDLQRASATLVLEFGARVACAATVLAAGAWSATLSGLPRPLAVRPLKGEMIRYDALSQGSLPQRPIYGAGVYMVSRGRNSVLVGATSQDSGFDLDLTDDAVQLLARGAQALLPRLRSAEPTAHWSGLRPMSVDLLPILGPDPDLPSLIYACGHSRNGILKAPLTGDCIAALFVGDANQVDLAPFSVQRHEAATVAPPPLN